MVFSKKLFLKFIENKIKTEKLIIKVYLFHLERGKKGKMNELIEDKCQNELSIFLPISCCCSLKD